ncbi:MAG: hypothetical protein JXO50_03640 [Deltaproteobacteria bacterium]|nr:hypothetical protein [Candidatus Anaeroferrophillus wilburensis]
MGLQAGPQFNGDLLVDAVASQAEIGKGQERHAGGAAGRATYDRRRKEEKRQTYPENRC